MKVLLLSLLLPFMTFQSIPTYKAKRANDTDYMEEGEDNKLTMLAGCSWYCGGEVSDFRSSSQLPDYKGIRYSAKFAHDFDPATAWVEGKPDNGIGEFLEYTFDMRSRTEPHQLGITTIVLANGYKKSRKAWEDNARVKKMKVYVDNRPYAILDLLDSYEVQTIEIGKIMLPQRKVMKMRFEILEVYPGARFTDTAISELLFEGVGVH